MDSQLEGGDAFRQTHGETDRAELWPQAIQAMAHTERPLFGVQFHPELFDPEHPAGEKVLKNFLEL